MEVLGQVGEDTVLEFGDFFDVFVVEVGVEEAEGWTINKSLATNLPTLKPRRQLQLRRKPTNYLQNNRPQRERVQCRARLHKLHVHFLF